MRKLFMKCPGCGTTHFINFYARKHYVCPDCNYHLTLSPIERIRLLTKPGSFKEFNKDIHTIDPLVFPNYDNKLKVAHKKTHNRSAVKTGTAKIGKYNVVISVLDADFMMGSMGAVVGEKLTRAIEYATEHELPLIIVTASGGARMQEGVISLFQMAKTSAALKRHSNKGLLYISILTHPTTGGVSASFAFLGDIIVAEPNALIGFAGPRVIQQTIGEKLPEGFQRSEFLLEHGMLDLIINRAKRNSIIENILKIHNISVQLKPKTKQLRKPSTTRQDIMEILALARHKNRPTSLELIQSIFTDFIELHGDRAYADDKAMVGGIALFKGMPVTVIGLQKGKNTKENIYRHFGMAHPEGYRKALRLMRQAEKFNRPIINLIDTPGAYPGVGAEERGQAEAIAVNLREMSDLKVPIISIITGEGGSGGALGLSVANKVLMLENSTYSVISPEGCASILWKDAKQSPTAAKALKISAFDLLKLGLIDEIIPEPEEGAHADLKLTARNISESIHTHLYQLLTMNANELLQQRYDKFRNVAFYGE
ncbi:MAG: acetyl-CoA carboxylase carboxyltransferase subunit alpha [Candidatus Celaenobacter polaris]|nr:acetyl-CoA carboxylase carboxyltransferase subunit alpha [Candidatus Celaenobacter polaris]